MSFSITIDQKTIERIVSEAVELAWRSGYVVTVETEPKQPLAMGNYLPKLTVRPRRMLAKPQMPLSEFNTLREKYLGTDRSWMAPCCRNENRGMSGGCDNCGSPCF